MRAGILAALTAISMTLSAAAVTEYFPVTASGSFDTFRGTTIEGYTNGGHIELARLMKANQAMGWMSFADSRGDTTGQTLAGFLAAHPNATATLEFRCGSVALSSAGAYMLSIRAGNPGALIPDSGNTGNRYSNPATGFAGASELVAFRTAAIPDSGYDDVGSGLYLADDPAIGGGQAWITPSTRASGAGMAPFTFGPNEPIRYDTGNGAAATGLYRGWFPNISSTEKRHYWALEDLLGLSNPLSQNASWADIAASGQIWNTDANGDPLLVNSDLSGAADPRNLSSQNLQDWTAVPLSAQMLADLAFNPENKGLAFCNNIANQAADYNNVTFYTSTSEYFCPYLVVTNPEPTTLGLLAVAGLLTIRRRRPASLVDPT